MQAALFCHHCQKHYRVRLDDLRLMERHAAQNLEKEGVQYRYRDECFFARLRKVKLALADDTAQENGTVRTR